MTTFCPSALKNLRAKWIALLVTIFASSGVGSSSAAESNYFQGKTIRLVVGSSSGGGYDLWARLLAQHIGKHIPGNPVVLVQNMPGAGGVVAANYVYGIAKPDGLTLGAFNPALYFDQLVGRPEVKFDWSKFSWIGSPEQNDVLHFIRTDAPFKTIDDSAQCQRAAALWQHRNRHDRSLHSASARGNPGHQNHHRRRLSRWIRDRPRGGTKRSGLLVAAGRHLFRPRSIQTLAQVGFTRVVVQTGAKRDERIKDVPTLNELMQQYKTPEAGQRLAKVILTAATLGRPITAPPGLSADHAKTLRDAYAATMKDPELLAEVTKRGWDLDPLTGADLETLSKEVVAQPREVIERMKWVLGK